MPAGSNRYRRTARRWSSPKVFSCTSPSAKSGSCLPADRPFGTGELLFDTLSPSGPRLSKSSPGIVKWGIRDAPRDRGLEPRAPIRRAGIRTGGLRVDSVHAAAPGFPADVRDAGAELRRGEPVRVLGRPIWTSMPSGDSARTVSSRIRPRSSAVLNSSAISWPCAGPAAAASGRNPASSRCSPAPAHASRSRRTRRWRCRGR